MSFTTLVTPEQLAQHLDDPNWVVFDCRFTLTDPDAGKRAYDAGHIPGARYADLNNDLSGPLSQTSGRHPLPDSAQLSEKLGKWGVDAGKQIIVYDDSFGAMAVRLWWLLRWLGHDAVALLDGGFPLWTRRTLPVSTEKPAITSTTFVPDPRPELSVSSDEVVSRLNDTQTLVLDARSDMRFRGDVEPLDKVAGHIPGAVNLPFEDNLDLDGTFLGPDELRSQYLELLAGKSPSGVIHMCGSGVTACHNLLAMELAGLAGGKLYVGSWSEWITDPSRPIATGE
jgi:thiosulfate/3-mercaptopyruvate sulfurtransferase